MTNGKNDRAGITLVGEEYRLIEEIREMLGEEAARGMTNPKILGMCMRSYLEENNRVRLFYNMQLAHLSELGSECFDLPEHLTGFLDWANTMLQRLWLGVVDPTQLKQVLAMVDSWEKEHRAVSERRDQQALDDLQQFLGVV